MGAATEIEQAVTEALGRRGVAASVAVRGSAAELHGLGTIVAVDLDDWVEQWALLPPTARRKRAEMIATRLLSARRAAEDPARGAAGPVPWRTLLQLAALAAFGVAAYLGLRSSSFFGSGAAASASVAASTPETPEQAQARTARVCEAATARLRAGASLGPLDTEGWVVELWLARAKQPSSLAAALGARVTPAGQLRDAGAVLAAVDSASAAPVPAEAPEAATEYARLELRGGYVDVFLEPRGRPTMVAWAEQTVRELAADAAALYATCAHAGGHEIGAWYFGADAARAGAALLYAAGHLGGALREPPTRAFTFEALLGRAAELDRSTLERVAAPFGASLGTPSTPPADAGDPAGPVVLAFPAGGPRRATSAASALADALGRRGVP
ncbi:MAG: hypothetical protein IT373_16645 [Polyangiaceae bacterium]|nr:hypothetical protein [Polyangiaceae bacterium]